MLISLALLIEKKKQTEKFKTQEICLAYTYSTYGGKNMDKIISKRVADMLERRLIEQQTFVKKLETYYPKQMKNFIFKVVPIGYLKEEWSVYGNNKKLLGSKRFDLVKENE